jgi:hypothetical protein
MNRITIDIANAITSPSLFGIDHKIAYVSEWVSELIYDRQSVGQSVLVSGTHLGPVTNFSFSLKFLLDIYGFVSL